MTPETAMVWTPSPESASVVTQAQDASTVEYSFVGYPQLFTGQLGTPLSFPTHLVPGLP